MKHKDISAIAAQALDIVTGGRLGELPKLAVTALLNDFQYAWLQKQRVQYKSEMLDLARALVSTHDPLIFELTGCEDVAEVRRRFSALIDMSYSGDGRVILSLTYDGKKVDSEWITISEYVTGKKEKT